MATAAPSPRQAKAAHDKAKGKKGAAAAGVERDVLRMTHKPTGRTYELDLLELGPGDDRLTRRVCGTPVSSFLQREDRLGTDGLSVLWWLARTKAGELVAFHKSEEELGSSLAMQRDMDVERLDAEDLDREAAAAGDAEGGADPT